MQPPSDTLTRLRALAREAQLYQSERDWSDAKLCKEIPDLGSTKTYKRILDLTDDLDGLSVAKQVVNYEAAIEYIAIRRTRELAPEPEYDDFTNVTETLGAVATAMLSPGIDRLVIVQGENGTGKDASKRALLRRWPKMTVEVEADELWRESVSTPLGDIIKALGVRRQGEGGEQFKLPSFPSARQEILLQELNSRKLVLLINEAHRMGPRGLNLITTIINKTPTVVVLFCIPTLITRLFTNAYEEAIQLIGNRLSEGVKLNTPGAEEIGVMLTRREVQFTDKLAKTEATKALAGDAPHFGNWRFVNQFIREARKVKGQLNAEAFTAVLARTKAKKFQPQRRAA